MRGRGMLVEISGAESTLANQGSIVMSVFAIVILSTIGALFKVRYSRGAGTL
jgi:hypothetical protein